MKRRFNLERYPPVDLRSDLGEFLIQDEKGLVLGAMDAVQEVIQLRAKDKSNIGRGDHAKPLGCYPPNSLFPRPMSSGPTIEPASQSRRTSAEPLTPKFVFPILNPRTYPTTDRRPWDSRSK